MCLGRPLRKGSGAMREEVWELRKEEEGGHADESMRGCWPPGAVTTCGQWSHFLPRTSLPAHSASHELHLLSASPLSRWGSIGINMGTLHFTPASLSALGENDG